MTHSEWYDQLRHLVDTRLAEVIVRDRPRTLYEPAAYILSGSGKRIRPVLLMVCCEAAGGRAKDALHAGVAVEILHNFTLVHDDIMDNADQRRGRPTVHKKWDQNVAILMGDALMGLAYQELLLSSSEDMGTIVRVFTEGLVEVCEGQALDKEFEALPSVSRDAYDEMIEKKTGRLVEMCAELGARLTGAPAEIRTALVTYASHIGAAFQVQDDLLDVIADEHSFGKSIGGDILEGKKTYLLVRAQSRATGDDAVLLDWCASRREPRSPDLVSQVTAVYRRLGVLDEAEAEVAQRTRLAVEALAPVADGPSKEMLVWFAGMLLTRTT